MKRIYPNEEDEQKLFIEWFKYKFPKFIIFAIPNGGKRNIREAVKMKRTGTLAGVPDICILLPDGKSFFVEMKRKKGGKVTTSQKEFKEKAESLGHTVIIGYGFEDASKKVLDYLGILLTAKAGGSHDQ